MRQLSAEALAKSVDAIYEAVLLPERWRSALQLMADATGSEGVGLLRFGRSGNAGLISEGLDIHIEPFANDRWFERNDRANRIIPLKPKGFVTEADIFTPDDLKRLPMYQELLYPTRFKWFAGAIAPGPGDSTIAITCERRIVDEAFTRKDVETLDGVLVHIRRAIEISVALETERDGGSMRALEAMGAAAALVSPARKLIRFNARFEQLVGTGLLIRDGRLMASHGPSNAALQRLLEVVGQGVNLGARVDEMSRVAISRGAGRLPLLVSAIPLRGGGRDLFGVGGALVMVKDPEDVSLPSEELLRMSFDLTATEARLAVSIARGENPTEVAKRLGFRADTARKHLQSVFAKTNTRRQSELVALIMRLVR